MTSRRRFLERLAAGGACAVGLDRLLAARAELDDRLRQDPVPFGELRAEYLVDPAVTYFNHASIGTIPRAVHRAREGYLSVCETNPWLHLWGGVWEEARERTRALAAAVLGCRPGEVALTHNTTEGFNLLASGLRIAAGDEVLFSSLNHPGASECWRHWSRRRGYSVRRFEIPPGRVAEMTAEQVVDAHLRAISPRTKVLVLPHLDNTLGLRHPVRRIAAAARAAGVRFVVVDGAQTVGMLPVDVGGLGVDAFATSPHKWLQAPKGLGLCYLRAELQAELDPMWVTWGQQRWQGSVRVFEDYGTRNLPEVLALGDAIEFQQKLGAARVERRLHALWSRFRAAADATPGVTWCSPRSWELGGSLYALQLDGVDSRRAHDILWERHRFVLRAFHGEGLDALRVSPNVYNTEDEIDRFFELLRRDVLG